MGELRGRGRGMGTGMGSLLPALAPDTALEMALLEMARFLFMISSNSTSLTAGGGGPSSRLRGDTRMGGGESARLPPPYLAPSPLSLALRSPAVVVGGHGLAIGVRRGPQGGAGRGEEGRVEV